MTFEELAYAAAARANAATADAIGAYADGTYHYEEDITSALVMALRKNFNGRKFAGFKWSASLLKGYRGDASEEGKTGADILIHVTLKTPTINYSKGVLVQAKRHTGNLSATAHAELVGQCGKMLNYSPASFVFYYSKEKMRCASATVVEGSNERNLAALCLWSSHRFFLELFRCPIGDRRITSALFKDLQLPHEIRIVGEGEVQSVPATRD